MVLVGGISVTGTRERRELTTLHGDRRASIKGALRLRTLPGQTVVEVAAPAQPRGGLPASALDDGAELPGGRAAVPGERAGDRGDRA